MEVATKSVSGQPIKTYKKGSVPNDGLMALLYAYMAYKFDVTKGYTIKPGFEKNTSIPRPALAYVPKLRA